MLDELYLLRKEEQKRLLTDQENERYVYLYETLRDNDIKINFGIEY